MFHVDRLVYELECYGGAAVGLLLNLVTLSNLNSFNLIKNQKILSKTNIIILRKVHRQSFWRSITPLYHFWAVQSRESTSRHLKAHADISRRQYIYRITCMILTRKGEKCVLTIK